MRFLKLIGYVLACAALLGASFAAAGWAFWEFVLFLIRQSK